MTANQQRKGPGASGTRRPSRHPGESAADRAKRKQARAEARLRAANGIGPSPSKLEAMAEAVAIRRMGWDVEAFRGHGPLVGLREAMRIASPARVVLRRRARAFDAIVISCWSRFGNAVMQLVNAAFYAERFGARRILAPADHDIFRIAGSLGPATFEPGSLDALRPGETALVGRLFGCRAIDPRPRAVACYAAAPRLVRPLLRPELLDPDPRVGDDDLVVHLRSGDIFESATPHRGYGQPPLAYYLRSIGDAAPRRVWLVYENRSNPVIAALAGHLRAAGHDVIEQSASLAEDLRVMLSARRLVIGTGTLMNAVAALSERLLEVHVFGRHPDFRPPGTALRLCRWVDRDGLYVDAVQRRNWANTPEQRRLMLAYPADALDLVVEGPRSR